MGASPNYTETPMAISKVTNASEEKEETLKIEAAPARPKTVTRLNQLKPGELFRYAKSGTLYLKARDGSIRNVDKAIKKFLKKNGADYSLSQVKAALGLPNQEHQVEDNGNNPS
jgi:hypothetical protein